MMPLLLLAQSTADQPPLDPWGVLYISMLIALAATALAVLVAVCVINLVLGVIVWTSKPRTRIGCSKDLWVIWTLFFGPFAAIPYFVLHYRKNAPQRCVGCNYDATGVPRRAPCPLCGLIRA